jgi:hypothetical protein
MQLFGKITQANRPLGRLGLRRVIFVYLVIYCLFNSIGSSPKYSASNCMLIDVIGKDVEGNGRGEI